MMTLILVVQNASQLVRHKQSQLFFLQRLCVLYGWLISRADRFILPSTPSYQQQQQPAGAAAAATVSLLYLEHAGALLLAYEVA